MTEWTRTYAINKDDTVTCLRCGRTSSFSSGSFAVRYCPSCLQYHEDNLVIVGRLQIARFVGTIGTTGADGTSESTSL